MKFYLYGLSYLSQLIHFILYIKECLNEFLSVRYKQLSSDTIVFFQNNNTPYFLSYLDTHNKNTGIIIWKFNLYQNLFYQYNCSNKDVKHFPIISAYIEEVKNDGVKEHITYLDDFFTNVTIEASNLNFPTLQQVLEVWSYSSGIVLDRTKVYNLVYLNTSADEITVNCFNDDFVFNVKSEINHTQNLE
jgi:hypothetical protein